LALIYIRIGQGFLDTNLEEAEKNVKKALEINPGDREATKILENLQKIKGKLVLIDKLKQLGRKEGE